MDCLDLAAFGFTNLMASQMQLYLGQHFPLSYGVLTIITLTTNETNNIKLNDNDKTADKRFKQINKLHKLISGSTNAT